MITTKLIIVGTGITFVIYTFLFLKEYGKTVNDKEDWPDQYIIKIIERDTGDMIARTPIFAFNKGMAERHAFMSYKAFYDDDDYEVIIDG